MTQKFYFGLTASLFLILAFVHLLRLGLSWEVFIGGLEIPTWVSLIAFLVACYLAYEGFRLSGNKDKGNKPTS